MKNFIRMKQWLRDLPWVCLLWLLGMLLGFFTLVTVVSWYIQEGTFQQKAASIHTTGRIVSIEVTEREDQDGSKSRTCTPTIRFFTRQQQAVEFNPQVTTGDDCNRRVGEVVNVAYHAGKPEEAQVVPDGGPWRGNLPILIMGVFASVVVFAGCLVAFIVSMKVHKSNLEWR